MTKYTCKACGVQQSSSHALPTHCPICEDDRQSVPATGQEWLILPEQYNHHQVNWIKMEENIHRLPTSFDVGIGQDAYFIETEHGNYLWDCVPLVSDEWVDKIMARGGLNAIIISHPHFYSNVACWSAAFGNIPIYIHHDDKHWVQDDMDNILFWQGERLRLEEGLTIVKCGGHFDGSSVLHWENAADGKAILFSADTICPIGSEQTSNITFLHSFPKIVPLPAHKVSHIGKTIEPFKFDRLYGAFKMNILENADLIVQKAVKRYIEALT